MSDDQMDERIREAARQYHEPGATPKEEIWARVTEARKRSLNRPTTVVALGARPRRWWLQGGLALAAAVVLGVAVGRWALPELGPALPGTGPVTAAGRDSPNTPLGPEARNAAVLRYAAVEHLTQVSALLTDYRTGRSASELPGTARELLSRTRLLMDARGVDPTVRALLEDLEILLVQVAQLASDGRAADRALIDDNLAERAIRSRLQNAIPAGPAA